LEEQLEADGGAGKNREALDIIRTELSRIGGVLESFRDFASIDRLEISSVSVNELVDRQLGLIRPQASSQNVQISFMPDLSLEEIPLDRGRIEQTLLNLLLNALESMPDGGKLLVRTAEQLETLRIEVSDTGPGIPEAVRDKILAPYFTTKNGGTGLGLAIGDKIMREHAGALEFESSAGGTTFRMNFSRTPIHE
jgi:two-component system nitrogen regulation sensor histidine kinase GlnL